MNIEQERQAVVAEARTWTSTPFHHEARVKGAGVDCAQLLYASFQTCGMIPEFTIDHYTPDWNLHRNEEVYLRYVLDYATEMPLPPDRIPLPADILVFRFGRTYSHGALVIEWPYLIHSYVGKVVTTDHLDEARWLKYIWENVKEGKGEERPYRVFALNRWC